MVLGLTGCSTSFFKGKEAAFEIPADAKDKEEQDPKKEKAKDGTSAQHAVGHSHMDLKFLLSMDYAEAKAISAQSIETASGARIAAESIEVLKKDKNDLPVKLRAKGKVYLETGTADEAKVLCQEVYITDKETVARGKPILQRGGSIVEGLEDKTVFYVLGTRLRVIGMHRLTNEHAMVASMPDLGPWKQGPNPLLPALTEKSVPDNIRSEMQKAAEAEAVLQQTRLEANSAAEKAVPAVIPPAQKPEPKKKEKPVSKEQLKPVKETSPEASLPKAPPAAKSPKPAKGAAVVPSVKS